MAQPHRALLDVAAGRSARRVSDDAAFVASAREHRMAGLAFWATENGMLAVGAEARNHLAGLKLHAAAHSARVEATTATIIGRLQAGGWEAAVFKGVATEQRWYPERGTRPGGDVDLFLAPRSVNCLDEILDEIAPGHGLAGRAQRLADRSRIQSIDFVCDDVWVDLHTDPIKVGITLPGLADLWRRVEPLALGGTEVPALDAETSMLQAAIHLQKDRFSRLHGFADVVRIARSGALDWDWIHGFAAKAGLSMHLNESLAVVAETLDVDLPIAPGVGSRLWRTVWPERSRLRGEVGMTRSVRTHYWIPLMMPGRRLDAIRSWSRAVFPPGDIVDYMHPDTSGPYLWRIVQYRTKLAKQRHDRNRLQRRQEKS